MAEQGLKQQHWHVLMPEELNAKKLEGQQLYEAQLAGEH